MCTYYENRKYEVFNKGYISTSFYTHQVTIIANASEDKYLSIKRNNWDCSVSYSKRNRKVYVRKLMRIAKIARYLPSHHFYKRVERRFFVQIENFGLNIYLDKDYEISD